MLYLEEYKNLLEFIAKTTTKIVAKTDTNTYYSLALQGEFVCWCTLEGKT
jgi:hypothetical protein